MNCGDPNCGFCQWAMAAGVMEPNGDRRFMSILRETEEVPQLAMTTDDIRKAVTQLKANQKKADENGNIVFEVPAYPPLTADPEFMEAYNRVVDSARETIKRVMIYGSPAPQVNWHKEGVEIGPPMSDHTDLETCGICSQAGTPLEPEPVKEETSLEFFRRVMKS